MTEQKRNLRLNVCICLALGLITLALYLPTIRYDFIQYDDQQYVTENPTVQSGLTARGLAWAFGYHAGNWHPLTWLSHMLDCQIYGLKPAGHHLTNVLLHVGNTLLLFLVLSRMTGAIWRSACVAALFAWHPLHVESVAWVAERKDVLCAFFWMLTLGAYANYVKASRVQSPKSKVWYGVTLVLFALALMSKPMAVTLPFVLLLLDFWPLERFQVSTFSLQPATFRRLVLEKIPFIMLSAVTCGLTIAAQEQAIVSTAGLPVSARISHAILSYAHYFGVMIVPRHLAVYCPYEIAVPAAEIFFASILLALVTAVAVRTITRQPYLIVGWLLFLGTLVPVIGLVQVGDQAWADRYTYLPLVGLFISLVWGTVELAGNRVGLRALVMVIGVGLLAGTTAQLRHWKNSRALFTHAAQVTRNNHMAITMLGSLLAKEGKLDEAIEHYRTALGYKPGYPEAHFFLGNALDQQGKLDEAITNYNRALWFGPTREPAHIFLGIAFAKQKKYDEATVHYLAALKLNPESAIAYNNFARLLHIQGRYDEAIDHYSAALKLDPGLAQAHNNLGILLLQKGQLTEGVAQLREALRLNSNNPEAQYNLALALNQQEQWSEASELFAKTVDAASPDPNAHSQFALALFHQQKMREAMSHYARALLIQPDFPDALAGLSWILATDPNPEARNGTEAVRMAERACELTGRKDPEKLKILAAAYAETGRFQEATATVRKALDLAPITNSQMIQECQLMSASFASAKPWRQAAP